MDWSRHKYEFHSKEDSFYCNSSDGVKVGSVPAVYGNLLGTPGVNKALFLASSQVAATSCKASSAKHLQLHHIQIHTLVQAHPCVLAAHDHRSLDISFRQRKCVRDVFVGCLWYSVIFIHRQQCSSPRPDKKQDGRGSDSATPISTPARLAASGLVARLLMGLLVLVRWPWLKYRFSCITHVISHCAQCLCIALERRKHEHFFWKSARC